MVSDMGKKDEESPPRGHSLHFAVNDVPDLGNLILFGFQQMMLCISGLLIVPFLQSNLVCAGSATIELRVRLIAASFFTSGIATILQTTFGMRLCILHGPSFSFLPPLFAFAAMPQNRCLANSSTYVPESEWMPKILTIQGSLLISLLTFIIMGGSGLVGVFAKLVGPITVTPLLLMLTLGVIPTLHEKMSLHWISVVVFCILIAMGTFLENVCVPFPYYSFAKRSVRIARVRIFGQFPYLISITVAWLICFLLTITDLEPEEGEARTDKNSTVVVLQQSPYFQIPYPGSEEGGNAETLAVNKDQYWMHILLEIPSTRRLWKSSSDDNQRNRISDKKVAAQLDIAMPIAESKFYSGQFGFPQFSLGLALGFVASCIACLMESIGDYQTCARISHQRHPPSSSVNRAIIFEGIGSILAAVMGLGTGVTTYAENIALMHITRVVSRSTMQVAGVLLILVGIFTKCAALLASIPDAVVGGVLAMGMTMITGVAINNLQNVDLRLSRNVTIMGTAILLGAVIPYHFERNRIHTGIDSIDDSLNMLLSIRMLVSGLVAFLLDNTVPGATREQRGFAPKDVDDKSSAEDDGYALPLVIQKFLLRYSRLSKLPFIPSQRSLRALPGCSTSTSMA
ncbi:hypothetical protein RB195_000995 [Necator americanus]|uniref:Permease n=1 Tax=Necator americanus TaxID=51031 RepID=A0ABR1DF76_NECAM